MHLSKHQYILQLLIATVLLMSAFVGKADEPIATDALADDYTPEIVDSLRHEISLPAIDKKERQKVREHMRKIAEELYQEKFEVETMREGEVVIATMQTDYLFPANETTLLATATSHLDKFKKYISPIGKYKIVLAVHSDNTGSEEYLLDLTEARINAILDYYENKGIDVTDIIGFPMSDYDPKADNTTRRNRALNRRLEVYIVPGDGMANQQKTTKKR